LVVQFAQAQALLCGLREFFVNFAVQIFLPQSPESCREERKEVQDKNVRRGAAGNWRYRPLLPDAKRE
jgi:hypothetical protein